MRKHTRIKTKTLVRINISCICTESNGMWIEGCVSFSVAHAERSTVDPSHENVGMLGEMHQKCIA